MSSSILNLDHIGQRYLSFVKILQFRIRSLKLIPLTANFSSYSLTESPSFSVCFCS